MGGVPRRRPPRLDYLPMKTLLAALLLAFAVSASAASVAMKPPVGITVNPASSTGWTTASNFVGTFSAASFSGSFTTNVGGKSVVMPASMRLAANAPQFAANAVRLNPTSLLTSAVVAWLLSAGLEWINGQWQVRVPDTVPVSGVYYWIGSNPVCKSVSASCSFQTTIQERFTELAKTTGYTNYQLSGSCTVNSGSSTVVCPYSFRDKSGATLTGNITIYYGGVASPQYQPSTESDWAKLVDIPDPVANDLAKTVALPLQNPEFNPPYVDVPLGEPYVDPVTGKRYQDKARITPQSDGKTADVQTTKQEVDEAGEPVTDPATGVEKPPEKQDDFCKQNPDSLACMEKGEPDELDLETRSNGSMVSPVSVGGAGHCMADKTLAMATMGRSITFTYKPICDLASMVRPLILALAWLLAGWIMVGAVKEN